ncbi:LysE family translocator [Paremcibacter congregatus]|uniref:Lysine transporter LysE n=1 Tax=Paremcibacter congregatus TaxID=2043170 RepID=A0A2G4YSJ8_9PROT|nr:LysE family transporter [Paremcibacter congregatus]PHZ85237.1 lysine transporter LysE [Paremcibacter congregatus]QDE27829.1 LysE family translocator [Paremcibacter congregatus]
MPVIYILWGGLIGILVAAPLGPVNLICIRRTLAYSKRNGFTVGMGAAVADTIFGAVAAFGLSSVMGWVDRINGWFEIIGGIILILVSINLWTKHPHLSDVKDTVRDRIKGAVTAFTLTIMNPMTILGFVALFVALGLKDMTSAQAVALIVGIFLGSGFWWFTITRCAGYMKGRLSDDHLLKINRVSALIVALCGIWALGKNLV